MRERTVLASNEKRSARIKAAIAAVFDNPYYKAPKHGPLKGCRALGFTLEGVAYRAVYRIDDGRRVIEFIAIATHDIAYQRASRRLR